MGGRADGRADKKGLVQWCDGDDGAWGGGDCDVLLVVAANASKHDFFDAQLTWGFFPCGDLSLAKNLKVSSAKAQIQHFQISGPVNRR